jgi:hypothetical protein
MANKSGNAYGLTTLIPIRAGVPEHCPEGMDGQTHSACLRHLLQDVVRVSVDSPMALVPNTYLSRFYILEDVYYQGSPTVLEHLKSHYLVFTANFHGDLEPWLDGMWKAIESDIRAILQFCYGFEKVHDSASFIDYIKKCQVETTFYFNGSTDEPVAEQLKNLYLKQEFSKFVYENQGKSAQEIQSAFADFVARTQPENTAGPTWRPAAYDLDSVVKGQSMGAGR